MDLNLKATKIFQKNHNEYIKGTRIVVNQGGRGSSKTYSLAQLFLIILLTSENILLTVCRKTLPALKATAMRDFFLIMKELDIYREDKHNKTEGTYIYKTNEIEFISVDEPQKIRGRKRQYLWMNETNEFSYEDFRQLNLRTERQIFMDFNPSDEFHWIYDQVLTRKDSVLIKSTYKDNPYLDKTIVAEIERLRNVDKNYWRIYGLGERGVSETVIYTHWKFYDDSIDFDEVIYGLDFGYNNPSALIKIGVKDKKYYWEEILYQSFLTNSQLIEKMNDLNISKDKIIYADASEPQRIEEIRQAGYNINPANKEVNEGIDFVKSNELYIHKNSVNLLKEIKSYCWKEKDEKIIDEPIKINDHLMDAGRYAQYSQSKLITPFVKFV